MYIFIIVAGIVFAVQNLTIFEGEEEAMICLNVTGNFDPPVSLILRLDAGEMTDVGEMNNGTY